MIKVTVVVLGEVPHSHSGLRGTLCQDFDLSKPSVLDDIVAAVNATSRCFQNSAAVDPAHGGETAVLVNVTCDGTCCVHNSIVDYEYWVQDFSGLLLHGPCHIGLKTEHHAAHGCLPSVSEDETDGADNHEHLSHECFTSDNFDDVVALWTAIATTNLWAAYKILKTVNAAFCSQYAHVVKELGGFNPSNSNTWIACQTELDRHTLYKTLNEEFRDSLVPGAPQIAFADAEQASDSDVGTAIRHYFAAFAAMFCPLPLHFKLGMPRAFYSA